MRKLCSLKFQLLAGYVNKVHNFGTAFDKWNCWPIEEGRAARKVIIKNLAIFFLFPSKHFLPISIKIGKNMQDLSHEY
jgi:hypothetical protein